MQVVLKLSSNADGLAVVCDLIDAFLDEIEKKKPHAPFFKELPGEPDLRPYECWYFPKSSWLFVGNILSICGSRNSVKNILKEIHTVNLKTCDVLQYNTTEPVWRWWETRADYFPRWVRSICSTDLSLKEVMTEKRKQSIFIQILTAVMNEKWTMQNTPWESIVHELNELDLLERNIDDDSLSIGSGIPDELIAKAVALINRIRTLYL